MGHSFGGAVALHLTATCPDLVSGLVLLDPAIGLDGRWMAEIAEAMLSSPDYPSRDEARVEKAAGTWSDVPAADLDEDLDEHLISTPGGRWRWRISIPAMTSYWSELARDIVLPHKGTPTTLVRALKTDPPYVSAELLRVSPPNWAPTSARRPRLQAHGVLAHADRDGGRHPRHAGLMAPITDAQVERVRALVAAIPAYRVSTYGDIARAAGLSSPRIVGWIMRTDSADLPWHRVITASGLLR